MQIEWAFLPLLDQYHRASPKVLEQRLADDPALFCEIIRTMYRSTKADRPEEEPTDRERNIAVHAYRLLSIWRRIPGTRGDGSFDGDAFEAWLARVRASCEESGHLGIAMLKVGHVLTHSPPDPSGLWIHHSVAAALNADEASDMRDGFRTELYNSRGMHCVDPTGNQERELAKKYRGQADELEDHGFHRLAGTLRELGAVYDREAEQNAADDRFEN
jgi:hypothetical protein